MEINEVKYKQIVAENISLRWVSSVLVDALIEIVENECPDAESLAAGCKDIARAALLEAGVEKRVDERESVLQ